MAQLDTKIKLYAAANGVANIDFLSDVKLQDDGDGVVYIHEWNLDIAEPTDTQLDNYESAGNAEELLKANISKRVYPSIGDQLDMLWHSIDQNPTLKSQYFAFYEAIKSVKVKNPK